MNLVGSLFEDKYQIIDILGKGGMSTVYLAKDIRIQKLWAIKQVRKDENNSTVDLMAETNLLKRLDHAALPRIVDIVEKDDYIYVVLDFIEGISLDKKLMEIGVADEVTVLSWAKQICEVLSYLHSQKPNPIIYRDMKPANLMLTPQDKIKLIDFGIAREYKEDVSQDTAYIGTKGYAAPEQYGRHQTDARTDIYSLGVTLYHLATGKSPNDPPFEIKPARQVNPNLSEGFEVIIAKCTQQDPNLRYQSVEDLIFDLENIHRLNSAYKQEARKKLMKLATAILAFILSASLTAIGVKGSNNVNQENYIAAIQDANESSNNKEAAKEKYLKAIQMNPDDPEAKAYKEAIKLFDNKNDYDGCIDFLLSVQAYVAKNERAQYYFGEVYFENADYCNANVYFSKVKKPDKNLDLKEAQLFKYYKPIAEALGGKVRNNDVITQAVSTLENYVETVSDPELKANGYSIIADIYSNNPDIFKNDSIDKTVSVLNKAYELTKDKNNSRLLEKLGNAYYGKATSVITDPVKYKENMNKSATYYESAIKVGGSITNTYYKLGTIYKNSGRFKDSEDIFNKEETKFNDYRADVGLGLLYVEIQEGNNLTASQPNEDNYKKVADYYQKALQKNPNKNDSDFIQLKRKYDDYKNQGLIR
ncbi:serine/threonine-protein kinase [Inconstantimicrobium mannanitabidum]|uniref:Serine/threonine protein kinase n=1 Tax=Inconstantimicrobium mannanitabidum TaxID=1604901 RepID=A0ACB5RE33_9CLOT|nr:serine/threonine-protein kinase [Clostridium sp. TW13]GKX67437.1 serine/threonine protein kinase [Clostridium sp. TW13]